nr:hypothetical protein DA06_00625 [Georgenia sp. SUBG003]
MSTSCEPALLALTVPGSVAPGGASTRVGVRSSSVRLTFSEGPRSNVYVDPPSSSTVTVTVEGSVERFTTAPSRCPSWSSPRVRIMRFSADTSSESCTRTPSLGA